MSNRGIIPEGDELPSDMMARLKLENGNEEEISAVDSLTTQPPNARPDGELQKADSYAAESAAQDGFICGISPFAPSSPTNLLEAQAHADNNNAASEASQALQALQTAAQMNGSQEMAPPSMRNGGDMRTKEAAALSPEILSESGSQERADEEEVVGEEEDEESSEISGSDEDGSWIAWFCSLRGNEFFCEVDEDYIQVSFSKNDTGRSWGLCESRRCLSDALN